MNSPCTSCYIPPRSRDCESCSRIVEWMDLQDRYRRTIKDLVEYILEYRPMEFDRADLIKEAKLVLNKRLS